MAKKYNYNSDYMSRKHDEELERLEERLTAVYANAANEVERQFNGFMSKFEPQYEQMKGLLEDGYITESEFETWSRNKILRSERYKEAVKQMTDTLVNTDVLAMAMVNSELPLVIAQSYNFVQSLGFAAADEAGLSVGTFQVYNARTVQSIIKDNPYILSGVNKTEDYRWNKDRVNNAITHSIVNGDSIPQAAKRLKEVTNMDKNGAVRNARTAMTAAENLGRTEASADLREKGIPCNDQWSATLDDRTRDTHLLLDGTFRDKNGYFGADILKKPLRFPGDPEADLIEPEEIYNCRCRISLRLQGVDHSQDGDLYEKFMKEQHPEDWAKMHTSERELDRAEQKADAIQAQADLKADIQTSQQGKETIPVLPVNESAEPIQEEPAAQEIKEQERKTDLTDQKPDFTPEQKKAIEYYVSGDGMSLNNMLRGRNGVDKSDLTPEDKKYIKNLDEALDKKVEDKILFRSVDASAIFGKGVDMYELKDELIWGTYSEQKGDYAKAKAEKIQKTVDNAIGKSFIDEGYVSTTRDEKIAREWEDFTGSSNPIVLEIEPGEKTKGADISQATDYIKEIEEDDPQKETLLARDQKFTIVNIYTKERQVYVKLKME